MKHNMSASELKDEGNKYFSLHKYDEAVCFYSQAINKNPNVATFYTNRGLCYLKQKKWEPAAEDCRRALAVDVNLIKGHFFLGQALLEMEHYDEAIMHLQRAMDLSKDSKRNYGDEIAYQMRMARKRRWNVFEEKRIKEEIELQVYLNGLILADKEAKLAKLREEVKVKGVLSPGGEANPGYEEQEAEQLRSMEQIISSTFDERLQSCNDLFMAVDDRRKKREVPDYLCGKISFEIMSDPVITPSGITYDRKDIEEHLQRVGHFDPVTRTSLTSDQLVPNLALKEVIDTFLLENEWANDY